MRVSIKRQRNKNPQERGCQNNFKSISNQANKILRNAAIPVPLKYFSNFWRSLKMPQTNFKVELKLKWTKYCVFSAADNDNVSNIDYNIIFTIKHTKLYVSVVTLSPRDNKKLSKLFSKGFERSVYWTEYI